MEMFQPSSSTRERIRDCKVGSHRRGGGMIEIIQQKKSVTDIIWGCRWKLTTLKEVAKMMGLYLFYWEQ
jgi:hypothetical protein